jgi:hypothetical protein
VKWVWFALAVWLGANLYFIGWMVAGSMARPHWLPEWWGLALTFVILIVVVGIGSWLAYT